MDTLILATTIIIFIFIVIIILITTSPVEDVPEIIPSNVSMSIDTLQLREHALQPFKSKELEDILHKKNPIGVYNLSVRKTDIGFSGVVRGSSIDGCRQFNPQPAFSYSYYINLNKFLTFFF